MTDSGRVPGSPKEWLARAQGDLALAHISLPTGGYYEDLCFHTQQAAEKSIKAVYLFHGLAFRYIHDLNVLLNGLLSQGVPVPNEVQECISLSIYAWNARYPGLDEPITKEELTEAVRKARIVVAWAEHMLGL